MWKLLVGFWGAGGKEMAIAAAGAIPGVVLGWFLNEWSQWLRARAAERVTVHENGHLLVDWRALRKTGKAGEYLLPRVGLFQVMPTEEASVRALRKKVLLECIETSGAGDSTPVFSVLHVIPR